MIDIFKLYDYLETKMFDFYREKNPSGKYGAVSGVITPKDSRNQLKTKFYCNDMSHGSPNGFIFPILGSLRALLEEKNGVYSWICDPFAMLDKIGADLVCTTVDRSRTLGNNPAQVGKDSGNWQTLYMRVKFEAMSMR